MLVSGVQQSDSYVRACICVCVYVCESKSVSCSVVTPWTVASFSVHGILQARILDWVTIPNPGIKSRSPALQTDSLQSEPPGKPICICNNNNITIRAPVPCRLLTRGKAYSQLDGNVSHRTPRAP